MSADPPIVILSSIEWDAAWQRHQVFASLWAASGRKVVFVENLGFRNPSLKDAARIKKRLGALASPRVRRCNPVPDGVTVITPFVLPPTGKGFRAVNRKLLAPRLAGRLRKLGVGPGSVVFAYLPTATTLQLLDRLDPALIVYDCVDNFSGHPNRPRDLEKTEAALLRRSALVLTTSRTLTEKQSARHSNVLELHQGVASEFFLHDVPARYQRFCYYGTLWQAIDYQAIAALAEAGFDVGLIGPCKEPLPRLPSNATWHQAVPPSALPWVLREYDALLLPYVDSAYNHGVTPAKTYECLATGRPVLASPLPALKTFGEALYTAREPGDWVRIARGLGQTESDDRRQARVTMAREHGHDRVFARLREAVERALKRA